MKYLKLNLPAFYKDISAWYQVLFKHFWGLLQVIIVHLAGGTRFHIFMFFFLKDLFLAASNKKSWRHSTDLKPIMDWPMFGTHSVKKSAWKKLGHFCYTPMNIAKISHFSPSWKMQKMATSLLQKWYLPILCFKFYLHACKEEHLNLKPCKFYLNRIISNDFW